MENLICEYWSIKKENFVVYENLKKEEAYKINVENLKTERFFDTNDIIYELLEADYIEYINPSYYEAIINTLLDWNLATNEKAKAFDLIKFIKL